MAGVVLLDGLLAVAGESTVRLRMNARMYLGVCSVACCTRLSSDLAVCLY